MSMTFATIFGKVFATMTKDIFDLVKKNGKNLDVTENDVRSTIEKSMVESCILLTIGETQHVIHEPEEYKCCTFLISRGDREGKPCGKRTNNKKSNKFCTVHFKATEKVATEKHCVHTSTSGEVCGARILKSDDDHCSKHRSKSKKTVMKNSTEETFASDDEEEAKGKKTKSNTKSEFVQSDEDEQESDVQESDVQESENQESDEYTSPIKGKGKSPPKKGKGKKK